MNRWSIVLDMARKLEAFNERPGSSPRRYPWREWTDGSAWEIRRGEDYDVATETMRVNLHVRADAATLKVRTRKIVDAQGEGLVFQFFDPDKKEATRPMSDSEKEAAREALDTLYEDAMSIYERARQEVTIPRSDGRTQKYAAVRYKQQIEKARDEGLLVPAIARIVRKPTVGFGHLEAAGRPDLMVESLVLDRTKPYHRLFAQKTVDIARKRMDERGYDASPS